MSASLDVVLRSSIPVELQGRVYSCRNTLQFFTIPLGLFFGGFMVDRVCTPIMENAAKSSFLQRLFRGAEGAGSAMVMFILGVSGTAVCLIFGRILSRYRFEQNNV